MIYVNPNWTYRELVEHIKTLKDEYQGILSSFSMWERGKWADFIVQTKAMFYKLKLLEWQIDNLWKYMNGYMPFYKLKRSCRRYK